MADASHLSGFEMNRLLNIRNGREWARNPKRLYDIELARMLDSGFVYLHPRGELLPTPSATEEQWDGLASMYALLCLDEP